MIDLPSAFKRFRKSLKLTQKQVSQDIHVAERVYQSYEYGKVVPSANVLLSIAQTYNISIDYIVGISDDPTRH